MVNLRDGRHGRFAAAARDALFDGDARGQPFDEVHVGFFELLHELPRVGRHAVEKTPLAFREEDVEGERRFARTAQARDDDHLAARQVEREVLQIVFPRAAHADGRGSRSGLWMRCDSRAGISEARKPRAAG